MGETELVKRAFLASEHVSALEHDLYDAMVRLERELASTGWLLLGCAIALEQIRAGVGQLNDNVEAARYYALTIAERACEDLRELGREVE